jgi:uncharacterized protein YdcH (DUF465 family)
MEKHDLHHEFPELNEKIHSLKVSDNHFRKLFDQYHEINNAIHRIETGAEVVADEVLNDYRLKRVHLKDELYELLTKN